MGLLTILKKMKQKEREMRLLMLYPCHGVLAQLETSIHVTLRINFRTETTATLDVCWITESHLVLGCRFCAFSIVIECVVSLTWYLQRAG